ncbi:hypothetical protein V7157_19290, partial [Neobacillus drentensis]|uniref:hypothetical protein n=1 Tax=Neobacillus drentensis TaxID=220684 RepID=UPI003000FCAE
LYGDQYPIVLMVPSPQKWMIWLKEQLNLESKLTSDEIDAATMYVADFLRSFSTLGISGITLMEQTNFSIELTECLGIYESIFNVAEHYHWALGFHVEEFQQELIKLQEKAEFVLFERSQEGIHPNGNAFGGFGPDFWSGYKEKLPIPKIGLVYGSIPEDANPEIVLDTLTSLRRN